MTSKFLNGIALAMLVLGAGCASTSPAGTSAADPVREADIAALSTSAANPVIEADIAVNGTVLHYAQSGSGSPLILMHGNGENHHIFDVIAARFAHDYTVYSVDSRNHGESAKTDQFSYNVMAEDIYQFIRALKLDKPDILGFSDGAINTLLLAQKYGDAVGKIALLGVNLKPSEIKTEILEEIRAIYEETSDPLFKLMLTEPNIELSSLAGITNPTLVVAGENDLIYTEVFLNVSATIPNAVLLIIGEQDHTSYIVDTDMFYPYAIAFFKGK
ncbi:putative 2-succinyl-6-hydroxy-2,4-cyclohexadiene-1-carboxylate synthase [Pillotina sp. SPG140]|jgi:pimeloyl-ACP methyl ester carboxylesterase